MEKEILEVISKQSIFGDNTWLDFVFRFTLNMIICLMTVRYVYYKRSKNKDFLLTFILFNSIIFFICFLLSSAKLKTGFAFGLFAIFSIIRYRTVMVPIREMGFFFVAVTLGLINSLALMDDSYSLMILLAANFIILVLVYILDNGISLEHENVKDILYEKIENIKPDKKEILLEDLRERTGLPIHRVDILKIDFLKDVARIHAFYYSKSIESSISTVSRSTDD